VLFSVQTRNGLPVFPGAWRKKPFPPRTYEKLTDYVVTGSITDEEKTDVQNQLLTDLNGFQGPACSYDDHELTEEWMMAFRQRDKIRSGIRSSKPHEGGPSEDEVIRTQVCSILDITINEVQDKVCNDNGILYRPVVGLGPMLKEVPVWGIDCYTRRMVELAISDNVEKSVLKSYGSPQNITFFIERKLLPAINAQTPDNGHNMLISLLFIVDSESAKAECPFAISFANAVIKNIHELGIDLFKIHPKGLFTGCIL
jgi:hypothetical protein